MTSKSNGTDGSTSATERKFTGLRRFNLVMGFLHLVQGILMILISNDTTYPIFTNYLNFDIATRSLKPNTELFYELPFGVAVSFFLLISAVAHLYLATIGYGRYVANLKKGMNPVRFYEYALSSSLMIVLIGMLIGIWDLGAIILIFTLNATMNLFGILMEVAGFIPALVALVFLSAASGREFALREVSLMTALLTVASVALFIWGLGLPYPLIKGF